MAFPDAHRKDTVSRIAQRLEGELPAWWERPLEWAYPYRYLDARYFKVNWDRQVVDLGLLVAVGVNAVHLGGGGPKEEALTYLDFPSGHQRHITSTNVPERFFRAVKWRTKGVGAFPNEGILANLATVAMLRVTEDWAFRRCMDMAPLWGAEKKPTKIAA